MAPVTKTYKDRMVVPMTTEEKATLQSIAYTDRTTMSEIVRKLVRSFIKRKNNTSK